MCLKYHSSYNQYQLLLIYFTFFFFLIGFESDVYFTPVAHLSLDLPLFKCSWGWSPSWWRTQLQRPVNYEQALIS